MGNNSKYKTRKILAATATVTMLATAMISTTDIIAEETKQQKKISTSLQEGKSIKSENRTYTVPGKGDVEILKQQERKSMAFSPYEPTGLYAKPNEQITINVEGNQDIQAYIGTYSYDASWREDSKIKSFTLKPGINTIQSPNGGMIYFYNKQQGGTIRTTVTTGGTTTPFFELGKHTKQDLINMLDQYPNAHAVELKGERVLITASPARVKKYLLGSNTDPVQLLKKMDEATRIQDKVAGLSEEQVDKHYVHYVEENHSPDYYMYAYPYRTAYVGDAIQYVLDINKFIKDGWGPWHEAGHLRQQSPWKFYEMTEVQNNIYSLAVEKAFTSNQPFRLQQEGAYTKAFQYLEQSNKNYDEISDAFVKLVMLWQLQLAYGEDFYPKLHQLYRDMPSNELPQTDENKKQLFMISASKVAKQNLLPFFEKWGLRPNSDTIQKVNALGYPILTAEIWKGTDSNPIKPDMPNGNNI
ncbi:M60 family metallopeptidase, partial [Bacillus wiedmannii]|uniref:M60 family metallopeptidase n=1 Tax=Bacillus wiedmannii TaxID=1890302 RepID=UPI0034D79790